MKIEEAIKALQNIIEYWTHKPTEQEAARMAIEALKEKLEAEKNEPLTMEELEKMETGPVYVVPSDPWMVNHGWKEWCVWLAKDKLAMIPGIEYKDWNLKDYGKEWIAYRREPKEVDHGEV